jgi:hypothetical protein
MFCPDPKAMDDLKPVGLPFDGCQYKNLTYKQVRKTLLKQPLKPYH